MFGSLARFALDKNDSASLAVNEGRFLMLQYEILKELAPLSN